MAGNYISRAAAAFTLFSLLLAVHCFNEDVTCSRTCIAEQCDNVGIRYGKYCGKGYWGCPGEGPCDDLDACCMGHDDCVDRFGMTHVKCHVRLRNCLTRVVRSGKVGFSKECPVSRAAPTMINGMDLAIFLSELSHTIPHDDLLSNKIV
ncbi:unnamed protein product [Lupinus luteus]|uniref:phospholipase A2 n=1 Tax=Lupinus luteus TaxID=3873 RepID=A0AAV1XRM7_LUPLU